MSFDESAMQQQVVKLIMNAVRERNINSLSTVHFIAECMKLIETFPQLTGKQKKSMLVEALKEVAKGKDNVLGTADDTISKEQLRMLEIMLEANIVEDIIELVIDITKHRFSMEKGEKVAKKGLSLLLSCCNIATKEQ
jgi:hypothetical protein